MVAVDLTTEIAGKTRIVAASLHIHNDRAKKASCDEVLDEFFSACHTHKVDVFGVDANMAFHRLLLRMPSDAAVIRAPAASDCCAIGIFGQQGASLIGDQTPSGQFYSLWLPDLFWAATDESSHYLLSTTLRPGGTGARVRAADTAAEKKRRCQAARNERLREAKKKPASAP